MTFEQQHRESNKAFAAFKTYLDLGPERSLSIAGEKLGKSKRMMEKWSRKFDWPARVQAHTAHLAELERVAIQGVALEKAVEWHQKYESVRREAWLEAEKTIEMVREARKRWEETGRVPGFEGMARMLELAFKLKQFAAGMPSEVKEVNTNIHAKIDVDWEIAIRKAYPVAEVRPPNAPPEEKPAVVDVEALPAGGENGGSKMEDGKTKPESQSLVTSAATKE